MRKFSKKIAMMMVLAMLVSMFSGIVSASAASVWSAKSVDDDHYAVVMGETIEVKKGEFIDFDLFKNIDGEDVEATEAGYEYTWESSDEEVIFIGNLPKKNGYARVNKEAEVGAEATITVNFKNLASGKSAERSFDVVVVEELAEEVEEVEYIIDVNFGDEPFLVGEEYELKATVTDLDEKEVEAKVVFSIDEKAIEGKYVPTEAGDVVIVATATIGEEKYEAEYGCTVINANIFDVEQTSMNSFKMYFDELKDVSKIDKADIIVNKAAKEGALKTKQFVKGIAADKDNNTVTVTLHSAFAKDNVISIDYKGESNEFLAVKGEVAEVVLKDTKVKAGEKTALPVKIYDEFGVDITSDELLAKVTIEKKDGAANAVVNGLDITIWAKDKTTAVQATYHTYTYTNGVEKTFKSDVAVIKAVEDTDEYSQITNWAITKETDNNKIAWDKSNLLALNDNGFKLVGKLTKTTIKANGSTSNAINTTSESFTFESSDSTIVIVLGDGTLIPVSKGSADILVKKGDNVLGVFTVAVVDGRKATSMDISVEGNTVISYLDQVAVKLAVKDQYGDAMDVTAIEVKDVKSNANVVDGYKTITEKNKVTFKGIVQGAGDETTTYYRFIKVGDATAYFEFTVKKIDGAAVSYKFNTASQEFNTSVASNANDSFWNTYKDKEIKVLGYDKNGMLAKDGEDILWGNPDLVGTVTGSAIQEGKFYVIVTRPQNANNEDWTVISGGNKVCFNGLSLYVDAVSGSAVTEFEIKKATAGNYVFNLYKGVKAYKDGDTQYFAYEYVDSSVITVKDDQKSYNITIKDVASNAKANDITAKTASGASLQAAFQQIIADAFDVKYNDAAVSSSKFSADEAKLAEYVVGNANTVVIKKANIETTFTYKGSDVVYKLAEVVNFPIVSVTCK